MTDYKVQPLRIMKQTVMSQSPTPAAPSFITVRRLGGSVSEGNMRFSTSIDDFGDDEDFKPGDEALLFLIYRPGDGTYDFSVGPFSAFRVSTGEVTPLSQAVVKRRGDTAEPLAEFFNKVEARVSGRR